MTDKSIKIIHKALRDFGYNGLTLADVAVKVKAIEEGTPGEDIISMFISNWIKEAKEIP